MIDIVDSKRRSELMAGIRGRDTAPELAVRSIAHGIGLRFRLHRKDLPGRPDLVFSKHRLAVFVHGCFGTAPKGADSRIYRKLVLATEPKNSRETRTAISVTKTRLEFSVGGF